VAERYQTIVCGAGPAGLAAAIAAAAAGARIALLDAQPHAGGQIWRPSVRYRLPARARGMLARALNNGRIEFRPGTRVVAAGDGEMLVESATGGARLRYESLVIATGARELYLPFRGWTLPGVTGAGGLQALAKQGWPIAGKRVVVAGTGPLLLAAAATLRRHGARVLAVIEQAAPVAIRRFLTAVPGWPRHALEALALRARLGSVPYRCGEYVAAAHGTIALEAAEVHGREGPYRIECDHLAVGYGLVPNIELALLLGCRVDAARSAVRVVTDDSMSTSVPGVFAAGEVRGVAGCAAALIEGEIAGYAAAGAARPVARLARRRARARRFAALIEGCFALDERVRHLADTDTILCRCEDVPLGAVQGHPDARSAKLATRCGMGACQGRVCGAALAEILGFAPDRARIPLFPVALSSLVDPFTADTAEPPP